MARTKPSKAEWERLAEEIRNEPRLKSRYEPVRFVNQGAAGYLIEVRELTLDAPRAMKILKPGLPDMVSADGALHKTLAQYFALEVERLQDVNHENVVKVYERGSLAITPPGVTEGTGQTTTPYYIMDFVDGAPITDFMRGSESPLGRHELLNLFVQVASGLGAIHGRQILHGDVKPDNVLVTKDGVVKLTDFGFAKSLVRQDSADTFWCQDKRYLHPELEDRIRQARASQPVDTGRSEIHVESLEIQKKGPIWELHSLGRTFQELLDVALSLVNANPPLTPRDQGFILNTIRRLIELRTRGPWAIEDWSDRYRNMTSVNATMSKLRPGYSLAGETAEYDVYHEEEQRIPLCDRVPMTRRLQSIIDHPLFQRLGYCTQLGVVHLVFRGAQHTRYEHSLGVMYHAIEYVRALWHSSSDQYFREACGHRELEALILAALLHDLGQYPFAHAFEESEREQNKVYSHEALTRALLRATSVDDLSKDLQQDLFKGGSERKDLERLLLDSNRKPIGHYIAAPNWDVSLDEVISVLAPANRTTLLPTVRDVLHDIVDGPIDADKMDYLRRDAFHLDVKPGNAVDFPRFVRSLTTLDGEVEDQQFGRRRTKRLALDYRGISSAEDLLMARYHMFTEVYWHRVVRSAERMLRHAVDGIREIMGDEDFQVTFFPKILSSSDRQLIEELLLIAGKLSAEATPRSAQKRAAGCVECLRRVLDRKLHYELLELRAREDDQLHGRLSNLWSQALRREDAHGVYRAFRDRFVEQFAATTERTWQPWQLLLDIPDPRSDRPEKYQFDVRLKDNSPSAITQESAVWRNFAPEFRVHARRIRVYVAKEDFRTDLAQSARDALYLALEEVSTPYLAPLPDR